MNPYLYFILGAIAGGAITKTPVLKTRLTHAVFFNNPIRIDRMEEKYYYQAISNALGVNFLMFLF